MYYDLIHTLMCDHISDINECASSPCDMYTNTICADTNGSYACICISGFAGNGVICTSNYNNLK